MSSTSLSVDPRIIPLVRSLKEQNLKSNDILMKKNTADISSEKTSENSTKPKKKMIEPKKQIENEKNKNEERAKTKNSLIRVNNKANTLIKKNNNTKISVDGSVE